MTATLERRRSGGPRTAAGKARSAQNARKHGLASPSALDPVWAPLIERLAHALAGVGAGQARLAAAYEVATADIDLRRARLARIAVLRRPPPRPKPATRDLVAAWRCAAGERAPTTATAAILRHVQETDAEPPWRAAARNLGALTAIERYERRAYSRRRSALRALAAVDLERTAGAASPDAAAVAASSAVAQTPPVAHGTPPAGPPKAAALQADEAGSHEPLLAAPGHADLAERTAGLSAGAASPDLNGSNAPAAERQAAAGPNGGSCANRPRAATHAPDLAERTADTPAAAPLVASQAESGGAAWEAVAEMAFAGLTEAGIARSLGLSTEDLRARHAHALDAGPDILRSRITAALLRRALAGDTRAAIFLAKARAGWRDSGPAARAAPAPTPDEAEAKRRLVDELWALIRASPAGLAP